MAEYNKNYVPVVEISEISDTEEFEHENSSRSYQPREDYNWDRNSPGEYGFYPQRDQFSSIPENQNDQNLETLPEPENEFDKMTFKTAEKIVEIRESVGKAAAQACQNMFDRRNQANREWQEMETSGRAEREKNVYETVEALEKIEEFTEKEIKAQEEQLNKYKLEMEDKKLAAKMQTQKEEKQMNAIHLKSLANMEKAGVQAQIETRQSLEKTKQHVQQGIAEARQAETVKRSEIATSHNEKLRQMNEEMEKELEAERQKRLELLKPKKKSLLQNIPNPIRSIQRYYSGDNN